MGQWSLISFCLKSNFQIDNYSIFVTVFLILIDDHQCTQQYYSSTHRNYAIEKKKLTKKQFIIVRQQLSSGNWWEGSKHRKLGVITGSDFNQTTTFVKSILCYLLLYHSLGMHTYISYFGQFGHFTKYRGQFSS